MTESKDAKQRILDAAIELFAQKGHDAVGVREIAKVAGVNISMISYYYEGKIGILKAIIERFHDSYFLVLRDAVALDASLDECMKSIVDNLLHFVKTNTALTMAAMNAVPLDIPELKELKAERVSRLIRTVTELLQRFDLTPLDEMQMSVLGPALITTILSHFRFKSVQETVFEFTFDDAFYERYSETIATLFLYGLRGLTEETHAERSEE